MGGVSRQVAVATELPIVLVACVVVGGLLGAGLDRLLHTSPWGLLVGGAVGLGTGVRDVLRRVGGTTGSGTSAGRPTGGQ